jgi:hypothetical protein
MSNSAERLAPTSANLHIPFGLWLGETRKNILRRNRQNHCIAQSFCL